MPFWTANFTRPIYHRILQDKVNGVPEIHYSIFGSKFSLDANVSLFTPLTLLTAVSLWLVARLNGVL